MSNRFHADSQEFFLIPWPTTFNDPDRVNLLCCKELNSYTSHETELQATSRPGSSNSPPLVAYEVDEDLP